jgi:diapolycopene oxygenase
MSSPTVVVGAGLGGLAAAIRLAAAGRRVTVLEKQPRVGGKLNLHQAAGFTFDTGPSLFTMPWVLRELFETAGVRLEDRLSIVPVEPTCRYFWRDGTVFDAWQQLPALVQEVARLSPPDVPALFDFLAHTARIYQAVAEPFLLKPFQGITELITPRMMRDALRIDALRTVDQAVRSYFRSPHLQQLFNRYATYNGSSPYQSPATFNLISYIELAEGGWYVQGGMYQLAVALEQLARELGVTIETSAAVERILLTGRTVRGVRLADGRELPAHQVVVNADPAYAYQALLPDRPAIARRLARNEPSCSGLVLFLGIDREYPQLGHHTIFFSDDYRAEFQAIFRDRRPAEDPTIYVAATCRSDPQHAPPGGMNLFVLVNAPADDGRLDWPAIRDAEIARVLTRLEQHGLTDLRNHIVYQAGWTPRDLAEAYNAPFGAIYGLSSNSPLAAFARPPQRARDADGLFFVGGGTHPGGGIPLVLLSGRAVARQMLDAG